MTTLNIPAPAKWEGPRQAQWKEARSVFPIYLALAKQLEFEIPFPQAKRNLPEIADLEIFSQVHEWLDSMDQRVMVHQLRHLLQMTTLNASEAGLRALIQRHLRKTTTSCSYSTLRSARPQRFITNRLNRRMSRRSSNQCSEMWIRNRSHGVCHWSK
jgi:hypothetical protein